MHPSLALVSAWIASLKERTGRDLAAWSRFILREGPRSEEAARAWLKSEHSVGTNNAAWLAQHAHRPESLAHELSEEGYLRQASLDVDAQYAGKKAALRPIYDALLAHAFALGPEVKACPCKTMVPLYRTHVFAQIKAPAASRIELGFCLRGVRPTARLIDTGGADKGDRITHRVNVTSGAEIDDQLLAWLRRAYDADAPSAVPGGADKGSKARR